MFNLNLIFTNKNLKLRFLFPLLFASTLFAQSFTVEKIEPPNWWTNLKPDTIELMVYGKNLSGVSVASPKRNFPIVKTLKADSKNYLFVFVKTGNLNAGVYPLTFAKKDEKQTVGFKVLERDNSSKTQAGFDENDVVYLIFVDRFCDGDTTNETIPNSKDEFKPYTLNGRHGGDLKGIISKLDYLKDLGVTALWITPVLENNMWMSYHGYAATDLYKVDPRFGTNAIYKKLVKEAHKRGIKIIMDHVDNHIGINHPWVKDTPMKDWFHGTVKNFLPAHHNKIAFFDVHGDTVTPHQTVEGWFTDYMPDLNKSDKYLANYMIENTIWWIQYLGIDGIREDTYPYNDLKYMARWAETIFKDYPHFNIVAEIWKGEPVFISEYQANPVINRGFNSHLPSVTDYALNEAFVGFLKGEKTLNNIYETLAEDFVYRNPRMLLTFLDNHDIDRAMYDAKNDLRKFKMALGMLLTTRGIPQILYGTEIGMNGGGHDGRIRAHFPGGFPVDSVNAFTAKGRNARQNEIFNFTRTLLHLRKKYAAMRKGKLLHFPPEKGVYVYFRIFKNQKIMVVVNEKNEGTNFNLSKEKYVIGNSKIFNLLNNKKVVLLNNSKLKLAPMSFNLYLLGGNDDN